ncbi:MAG: amidohydrolase family protein [Burkholderiales bacterium]
MAYDLVIRNGTVVDGKGTPRFHADVAAQNGKIVAIGKIDDFVKGTISTIDAAGKIVCPGFVDPHTHYDAQITWDQLLSSSSEHGVTTVMMGNCGVGIAPCKPAVRGLLTEDLVTVEGIDHDVLTEGIRWDWETFPEFMDAAAKRGSAINLGFIAPLSPFRTYVLGTEANERAATPAETQIITGLLRDAMQAGAWGFSTTTSRQHIGHGGKPLSARLASRDELTAYCGVLKQLGRGVIEMALTKRYSELAADEEEMLKFMLDASERPVTWLSLHNLVEKPNAIADILERVAPLIKRGALPQILTRPLLYDMNLRRPFMFTEMISAKPIFDASFETQMAIYADDNFHKAFKDELKLGRKWAGLAQSIIIVSVENPALKPYEGMTIGEVAKARGKDPDDVFFDIAVEDQLQVKYVVPRANTDKAALAAALQDSRTLIGLSDAGAHLDMLCESGYTTYLLGYWVREEKALTLERAIQRITSEPADFFGIKGRGRLETGAAADIVVFDENKINSPQRPTPVKDLPAGGTRLYAKAEGISHVVVNGRILYQNGKHTGAVPGEILRSH